MKFFYYLNIHHIIIFFCLEFITIWFRIEYHIFSISFQNINLILIYN